MAIFGRQNKKRLTDETSIVETGQRPGLNQNKNLIIMKTKISFLEFMIASILFGIGAENDSLLILLAGLFFIILVIANEVINSKTMSNENRN